MPFPSFWGEILCMERARNELSSLRSRRDLGGRARVGKARGGMRRREKESEEKWEGRERNSGKPYVFSYFASVSGREILIG
jgi:hypothetical protein